jgi:cyclase
MKLIEDIRDAVAVPMTVLGGAGSLSDIKQLIDRFGVMGAAAGSLFVFKGVYKAVLINYPRQAEIWEMLTRPSN